ncbi:hypothetical protein Taro_011742 [Colocasia esculenta]|uniref:CCHC-type domain-containing protein n=1 Tax=Colocasia esculenta TaxID=4460 RepID=A0A843UBP8_COLES|nr:hypothetical protein [Colocasia esculenta]
MQDTVVGLTQALQNVVQAGNQAAATRNGAGDLHRNFRRLNSPRFSGSPDPDEAENWQEEIERIFQVMQCTNREKVVLATFQFTKDARAWWKATSAHLPNVAELEWAGFLEIFRGKYFSERVKERKAAEFAALKQKGMSVAEYEAQFAHLAVYAPHLVGTERLKANRFMDGLRPMFIEKLGPHNIQTYTEMVQRAQQVEDTMAKVEGMRGKDISKPTLTKRGAVDTTGTFPNNNDNNNKRPTTGKDYSMEKKIKVEETTMVEYCNFCNKPGHRAEECWKKAGACLRCGSRDHRLSNCPMLKDQAGRNQGVVKRQGRVNAITPAELPEGGKRAHTLPEEPFWRLKGAFQICLHLQKLQAILSRGRTRESRGIPGEKLVVQGKGADPTEEAQEKKDFWHFRCHQSRASPIEENLHRFPSRLLN